jgi:enterochelin esterase family protein
MTFIPYYEVTYPMTQLPDHDYVEARIECERLLSQGGMTPSEIEILWQGLWQKYLPVIANGWAGYLRRQSPDGLVNFVADIRGDRDYVLGPDSRTQPGVPNGTVSELHIANSKTYSGVSHEAWLYLPARYESAVGIPLMVFLDGEAYVAPDGPWRVPAVLDNLIARGDLPPMTAVFVNPGPGEAPRAKGRPDPVAYLDTSQRSVEYDTLDDTYAAFLIEEVIPLVRERAVISDNPEARGIAGHSSGGIGAFTVAWHRPDQFHKVHSSNGSFTNKRGGHAYPDLVRSSERKPIRIWQQSGARDLVHPVWGAWAEANQHMAVALQEKGYDHRFVFGVGSHSSAHAASLLPDALCWLWRDFRP